MKNENNISKDIKIKKKPVNKKKVFGLIAN